MTDTDIVNEYCALAEQAAFDDERLVLLRERMTDADVMRVKARLRAEAKARLRKADALESYGRRRKLRVVENDDGR